MLETRTLWELISKRAEATPDAPMIIGEDGTTLSFAAYRDEAGRVAAGLHAGGVGAGTVVSWQLPTWPESLVLVGALARLDAVQNPIIPIYREREVGFIARQAKPKLLIVPSVFRDFDYQAMAKKIAADVEGLEVLVADRTLPTGDPSTLPPPPDGDGTAVRWLFYTSGTTADPKGAQHTDATVLVTAKGMSERLKLTPEDKAALVFPFTHIGGICWMLSSLLVGFPNLTVAAFDLDAITLLSDQDVTLAGAGTPFFMAYLKAQEAAGARKLFGKVRSFPGGGAPKPPQLHYEMKKVFGVGIHSGYGLTESPILTMASVDDPDEALANTEGRPMHGVELRILTLDGKIGGPNEEGEIRAKAPQMMKGYLDSSLDAEAFDDDGYFRTGDLGFVDPDGFVVITGRLKDVIIRKGENISAKEIEDHLFDHDKVADVAVIGLPDPEVGERCCAVVVPADANEPLDFDEMVEFLKSKGLMIQKLPERLEIVDALPRNPAGKILKFELRDRYAKA